MRPQPNTGSFGQSSASFQSQSLKAGDIAFARMEKVNAEIVAITYGALVAQIIADKKGDLTTVNRELDQMGYNMGIRLIDEFLAKNGTAQSCQSFDDAVETLARIAFKMFLGIDAEAVVDSSSKDSFFIIFQDNPLNDFVELPDNLVRSEFRYSNLYCGIIRGAFEQLHMNVQCEFAKDILRGDDTNSIRVKLLGIIRPETDDE
jgi:hypothetical protein